MSQDSGTGPPPRWTRRQVRDLFSLLAMVVGAAGLVTTAFLWRPLIGWAALAAVVLAAGVLAGVE